MVRRRARTDEAKEARRDALLAAAALLYQERNYQDVSVAEVAEEAGVAKGTVYLYFPTKEALFLSLLKDLLAGWLDEIDAVLAASSQDLGIDNAVDVILQTFERQPALGRLFAILHVVLERNVGYEEVLSFKRMLVARLRHTSALLETRVPWLAEGQGFELFVQAYIFLVGVQQIANPAPVLAKVYAQEPELAVLAPESTSYLRRVLRILLQGLAEVTRPASYRIGLTGNIATGKSTVAQMLATLGADTIDADQVTREVMSPAGPAYPGVVETFGTNILDVDGRIDRRSLGRIVFGDPDALERLEALVHPHVIAEVDRRIAQVGNVQRWPTRARWHAPVVVVEAIKLLESGMAEDYEAVWVTTCDEAEQLVRVMVDRSMSRDEALARIHAQPPQAEKVSRADVVIDTNGTMEETRAQVEAAWVDVVQRAALANACALAHTRELGQPGRSDDRDSGGHDSQSMRFP